MKAIFTPLLPKLKGLSAVFSIILLASCGTYNNTGRVDDGIYGSDTTVDRRATDDRVIVDGVPEDKNNYYQQYFSTKAQELDGISEEDKVFTDVESYSTRETLDPNGYVIEQDLNDSYGAWGENDGAITINVYDNGFGNYNYWNYGYFNYWGYNNYFFAPAWFRAYGYGGGFYNGFGFNRGFYGGGFFGNGFYGGGFFGGGFYGGFNPFFCNGYFGNPYAFNSPYNGGFVGRNGVAYQGARNGITGRSNRDFTTRRNSARELRNLRSNSRNSLASRRNNALRSNNSFRNRSNTRSLNNTRSRPTTINRNAARTRSNATRSNNTRSRSNSSVRSRSSSRSSGSYRSSGGSSRSSGGRSGGGRSGGSRRGGK